MRSWRLLKKCHEVVHEMGVPRIGTTIRLGTRTDREQSMQDKIDSVQQKLDGNVGVLRSLQQNQQAGRQCVADGSGCVSMRK